jgi:LAO/AO transport system kinase
VTSEGVPELWAKVEEHRAHLEETGTLADRRRDNLRGEVFDLATARAKKHLERSVHGNAELERLLERVHRRELDPLSAVRAIMDEVFNFGDEDRTDSR